MTAARSRLGILISGRGSNMAALCDAVSAGRVPAEVAVVISNVPAVAGVGEARRRGVTAVEIPHRGLTREAHEARVTAALEEARVDLVCLAGYMRLLSPAFVRRWQGQVLNVHPSLLPAFPGLDGQAQALAHGVKVTGCTVHFVDEELDHGPIIVQQAVPVLDDDDVASLSGRILAVEHQVYAEAVRLVVTGRVKVVGRRVIRTRPR
jgi:phosphoribosylglycinamide formyltransferase-1